MLPILILWSGPVAHLTLYRPSDIVAMTSPSVCSELPRSTTTSPVLIDASGRGVRGGMGDAYQGWSHRSIERTPAPPTRTASAMPIRARFIS
jgi:hypothetical protein